MTLASSPLAPSTSADDQTYIWDAWNRLVEVKEGEATIATYRYDGLNRRIVKTIDSTDYHYYLSEANQVLEEQIDSGSPAVRNEFVWHPYYIDALAARWDNTGESGVYYHPLHDANFNITTMINGSAAIQERYHYTPYGQTTVLDSSFANPTAISSINQENLYTARQLDPETGLYYYRARYYHSVMGRFMGRDALEFHDGMNLYQYVGGMPLRAVDPSGNERRVCQRYDASKINDFLDCLAKCPLSKSCVECLACIRTARILGPAVVVALCSATCLPCVAEATPKAAGCNWTFTRNICFESAPDLLITKCKCIDASNVASFTTPVEGPEIYGLPEGAVVVELRGANMAFYTTWKCDDGTTFFARAPDQKTGRKWIGKTATREEESKTKKRWVVKPCIGGEKPWKGACPPDVK